MSQHALLQFRRTDTVRLRPSAAPLLLGVLAVAACMAPPSARAEPSASVPAPVPSCAYGDVVTSGAGYDRWATTIVDTELRLPSGYAPPDLAPVGMAGFGGTSRVRALVIDDLRELATAAKRAGAELGIISAYRSEASQRGVFAEWERQVGHDAALLASARPGHSEHELGTTVDFTTPDGRGPWNVDFAATAQGRWLHEHAATYGFVESYPATSSPGRTCYQAEPWHFRYVGRAEAKEVVSSGQPLRVFLFALLASAQATPRASAASPATGGASPATGAGTQTALPATDAPAHPIPEPAAGGEAAAQVLPAVGIGVAIGMVLGRLGALLRVARAHVRGHRRTEGRASSGRR